jgi:hypothetical protein
MPRCPLCHSANITILLSLHPSAFCSSCGARWIQDGAEQRAIKQVDEPALFASPASRGPSTPARQGPTLTSRRRPAASLLEDAPW